MFIYWKIYEERVGNCEFFYILRRKNNRDIVSAFLSCLSSISLDFLRCRYAICCIAGNSVHQHTRAFSMVFVKQLQLDEVIHNVILKFRHSLMERKTIINIHDIENVIYTDEKWLTFILSQIVQNAIKYFDKQENKLTIYSQDNGTNILLVIEDNGCGIKASDLSRVFEKGFTGSNRNKANATGMGLYLSKKLCDRLGLKLDIASTEKEYTRLTITFPKGIVHNFSE